MVDINLPVRSPTPPSVPVTPRAAPLRAGPADEVTFERPWVAFVVILETASLDFAFAFVAASAVEACRFIVCRKTKRACRSIVRDCVMIGIETNLKTLKR